MEPDDRWKRLNSIWQSALGVTSDRREKFVRDACGATRVFGRK